MKHNRKKNMTFVTFFFCFQPKLAHLCKFKENIKTSSHYNKSAFIF